MDFIFGCEHLDAAQCDRARREIRAFRSTLAGELLAEHLLEAIHDNLRRLRMFRSINDPTMTAEAIMANGRLDTLDLFFKEGHGLFQELDNLLAARIEYLGNKVP